jgi:hypothetical protein
LQILDIHQQLQQATSKSGASPQALLPSYDQDIHDEMNENKTDFQAHANDDGRHLRSSAAANVPPTDSHVSLPINEASRSAMLSQVCFDGLVI